MASNFFISTASEVVLVDARTRSGTVTLPTTSQIPYRILGFKDQYGAFSNSTFTLSTQTGQAFDDGTTSKTFSNAFTSINLYAATNINRWMVMNATQSVQQSISSLIVNQLVFGTGAGWVQFGPLQATILSSIQQTTAQGFFSSIGVNCNAPTVALDVNGTVEALSLSSFRLNTSSIGINTSTPWQYLEVTGISSAIRISDYTPSRNPGLEFVRGVTTFGADTFTDWRIHNEGGILKFYRKDTFTPSDGDAMVITDLARVGINCNAPGVSLDVAGTARSFSTVTSSITLGSGAGWVTTGALQAAALSSIQLNTALGFVSTLYVGSTTTQLQGYTARINGLALVSSLIIGQPIALVSTSGAALLSLTADRASKPGTTTWGIPSDLRIKENIVNADIDRCYNDIKSVALRRFNYKPWFFDAVQGNDKHVLGFIAQEVSSIIPKVVTTENAYGFSDFHVFNIDQLNMSLYGAVKKTIADKEILESTVKGQRFEIQTLQGSTSLILSTLEGLQGR